MAIYRMLRNLDFGPQEISKMTTAYEVALIELGIADRTDPQTEIIASAIIHRAGAGEFDVQGLVDFAIRKINAIAAAADPPEMPVTRDFSRAFGPTPD